MFDVTETMQRKYRLSFILRNLFRGKRGIKSPIKRWATNISWTVSTPPVINRSGNFLFICPPPHLCLKLGSSHKSVEHILCAMTTFIRQLERLLSISSEDYHNSADIRRQCTFIPRNCYIWTLFRLPDLIPVGMRLADINRFCKVCGEFFWFILESHP